MDVAQHIIGTEFTKKVNLNYKQISSIGLIPPHSPFLQIQSLHLSYNNISSLFGIDVLQGLKSLSLNNNLITNINEFNNVTKSIQFLNLRFNPFIKLEYGYYEYFYVTFPNLRKFNGETVKRNINQQLISQGELFSRWFIYFLSLLQNQYDQALIIKQKQAISIELGNDNLMSQKGLLIDMLDSQLIEQSLSLLGKVSWGKEFTQAGLLDMLNKINQCFKDFRPTKQQLSAEETSLYKKCFYETFRLMINHQSSTNNPSFIDYLIKLSVDHEDYYTTFKKVCPPQAHIDQDLYEIEIQENVQQRPRKTPIIPDHIRSKVNKGLTLDLVQNSQEAKPKQTFVQYFPVFTFRHDYMSSLLFVLHDGIERLKNIIEDIGWNNKIEKIHVLEQDEDIPMPHQIQVQKESHPIAQTYSIQQDSVAHHRARRLLFRQFTEYLIKCLQRTKQSLVYSAFNRIIKSRRKKQKTSRVNKLFTQKRVFDTLKHLWNAKRFGKLREQKLLMIAFVCLNVNSKNRKNQRKAIKKIIGICKLKYFQNAIILMLNLKDRYAVRSISMGSQITTRPAPQKQLAYQLPRQMPKEDQKLLEKPQQSTRTPKKSQPVSKMALLFQQGNLKTCSMCNFKI